MKVKTYQGKVVRKVYAEGSKSQHDAVTLVTDDDQELKLRRLGANPFQDRALDQMVGMQIRCTGTERGSTLLIDDWEESESDSTGAPRTTGATTKRANKKSSKKSANVKKSTPKKRSAKKKP